MTKENEIINALGKPCPLPVIAVKKAARQLDKKAGTVKILVDNKVAVENIQKLANGMGFSVEVEQPKEEEYLVTVHVPEDHADQAEHHEGLIIAIGHKTLGGDDEELGSVLMKSFIYSLTELDTTPEHLLFFNGGAFLTTEGSPVLKDLQTLSEKGAQISTCGTCTDYYNLTDKVAIGEITNMYGIVDTLDAADKVINL
ncbi:sulfurtransferase-like selenium metabolism protein YedF [Enterococcus hirae]|jgi:selenium metabolism protein YedF|nr:sulfurtransferase-like selenium metabolism protein YedF [Enterococcaceae bacterium]MCI1920231.1 sulfurtransferase-like selenium metabolism protein YedF [Enterococcaceae bacterium]MDM8212928.1 sulfurtransferase-like selenium metabolism protein YedF [Enterococcus hirae]